MTGATSDGAAAPSPPGNGQLSRTSATYDGDQWLPGNVLAQPVSRVQWLDRETLTANTYNPNTVAPAELRLLAVSIIEDGWTQPLVVRSDREIVDGFHRWTVSGWRSPDVWALTDGLVPCVILNTDPAHQRMSTVRHNRARGQHHVVRMADIVAGLVADGATEADLVARLGMDPAEVRRLLERGNMTERAGTGQMGEAWRPAPRG